MTIATLLEQSLSGKPKIPILVAGRRLAPTLPNFSANSPSKSHFRNRTTGASVRAFSPTPPMLSYHTYKQAVSLMAPSYRRHTHFVWKKVDSPRSATGYTAARPGMARKSYILWRLGFLSSLSSILRHIHHGKSGRIPRQAASMGIRTSGNGMSSTV